MIYHVSDERLDEAYEEGYAEGREKGFEEGHSCGIAEAQHLISEELLILLNDLKQKLDGLKT